MNAKEALELLHSDMAATALFDAEAKMVEAFKVADSLEEDAYLLPKLEARQARAFYQDREMYFNDRSMYRYENLKVIERFLLPQAKEILKKALETA